MDIITYISYYYTHWILKLPWRLNKLHTHLVTHTNTHTVKLRSPMRNSNFLYQNTYQDLIVHNKLRYRYNY